MEISGAFVQDDLKEISNTAGDSCSTSLVWLEYLQEIWTTNITGVEMVYHLWNTCAFKTNTLLPQREQKMSHRGKGEVWNLVVAEF